MLKRSKRLIILSFIGALVFLLTRIPAQAEKENMWTGPWTFSVSHSTVDVFGAPEADAQPQFQVYKNMRFDPTETVIKDGYKWFKLGDKNFWVPAVEPDGIVNFEITPKQPEIVDLYGILDQPHRYAVKMVKYPGAKGRMETYEKVDGEYIMRHTYTLTYRREGPKTNYGDLKSPGGNVIRYLYRTTKSSMNGWDKNGEKFGVYKVSFPMPHDALPHLMAGRITPYQYNKIPTINWKGEGENRMLYPHPPSYMGADIVLHTKRWGSRGCINIENEAMSYFYHHDIVTENDKEIIPLVIYDEDVIAPPIGELF